uniref:XF1762 family protein n=1 Tax=Streptosporangium sp. CA-235898 TaxID=3240073 RepID=UPI003F491B51
MTADLHVVPVVFKDACGFVEMWHRHHDAPQGHKFSIGAALGDVLVGVIIVGRPVARHLDNGQTLEVTRLASDGTPNVCSLLYSAAWRAAKALGFTRLITYIQADEPGTSLRASGWRDIAARPARPGWNVPSRPRHSNGTEGIARTLWEAL